MDMPSKRRTVGKHEYKVTMLPLGRWIELQQLVAKLFGGALEEFFGAMDGVQDIGSIELAKLMPVIRALILSATVEDLEALFDAMGRGLQVREEDGGWTILDRRRQQVWWAHNMGELAPVAAFFLEVQFRDFFAGLLGMVGEPMPG